MNSSKHAGTTVEQFALTLMPWSFPDDWFAWPPDVFALTSAVLGKTGCYRRILSAGWSSDAAWQSAVEDAGQRWMEYISAQLSPDYPPYPENRRVRRTEMVNPFATNPLLMRMREILLEKGKTVTLERLRILDGSDRDALDLCEALLQLHAIVDESCAGFGFLGDMKPRWAMIHCLANLLLTAKGSLSTLPKHCGIVIPKARTPQKGMTIRSFSHHLTYHETEVEVVWRALPWPNVEENTINILAIPWPQKVPPTFFQTRADTFQPVRYFRYVPTGEDAEAPLSSIVRLVQETEKVHCRLHLVVLPECALSTDEYRELLALLREARRHGEISRVPMVIAGVRRPDPLSGEEYNEVRLASYFVERWYEITQWKHHRWKLDRNQIRQYKLEGRFTTARNWYEEVAVGQRRLTFVAPNGWLALCPLICEDLAQLEPVSELIRGIGPTLLVALLADGPQVKERWSARYASVFADDPGTAVLTLTSLGMVNRSHRLEETGASGRSRPTVGLWRDHVKGWREIDLKDRHDAILLTISSDWQEEYTADGRGDNQQAAIFKLEGERSVAFTKGGAPAEGPRSRDKLLGDWSDIRELSAATFALNSLLHLGRKEDAKQVLAWLRGELDPVWMDQVGERLAGVVTQIIEAQKHPQLFGIAPSPGDQWPTPSMSRAIDAMEKVFSRPRSRQVNYWSQVAQEAMDRLRSQNATADGEDENLRIGRAIPYMVLTCIHGVLDNQRRKKIRLSAESIPTGDGAPYPRLSTAAAAALFRNVEEALEKFG